MKNKILMMASKGFIILSAFSFLWVSLLAFFDPQGVMDLVQVQLTNNDAISSIRGVYGGVGLALAITLLYLMRTAPRQGLLFLSLIWGLYAVSRIITIVVNGHLGAFGIQWLYTESFFFILSLTLLLLDKQMTGAKFETVNASH